MDVKIHVEDSAVKYLSYVFDEFASRFPMSEYIPAIYWAIDSGAKNEHGEFVFGGNAGYHVVLVKIDEARQDLRLKVAPNKIFALRLDPIVIGKSSLNVLVINEKIDIE